MTLTSCFKPLLILMLLLFKSIAFTEIETKSEFDEALLDGEDKLLMIDFYAAWCWSCKVFAPKVAGLERQFEGKVLFYKVDTDNNDETAAACGISTIPTFQLYKNGKMIASLEEVSEAKLVQTIAKYI